MRKRRVRRKKSILGKKVIVIVASLTMCCIVTAFVFDTQMKDDLSSFINQTLDLNLQVTLPEFKELENLPIVTKYNKVKEVNKDVIGWIRIANTNIDYPILYKDNSTYLYNDYKGTYNFSGSIFLDESCGGKIEQVTLLHGHNMRDGTMFGSLKKFVDGVLPKDSLIEVYNGEEIRSYEIFSMFYYNVDKMLITTSFRDNQGYMDYVQELARLGDSTIDEGYDKEVIVMSTCTSTDGGGRWAVVAKRK